MRTIYQLFARSPFGPLVEHTKRVHETVELVRPLFEAFLAEDWDRTEEIYRQISKLEHKADEVKIEIRNHLPRSLFLPVDRGDVLKYLKEQDAIADAAEDLGVILTLRRTICPEDLKPLVLEMVDQVVRTSELLVQIGTEMDELLESTFGGPEVERVLEQVDDVNRQEWEADKLQWTLARALLSHEEDLDPVSLFMWMHTIEVLGGLADHAENTADLLRLMISGG